MTKRGLSIIMPSRTQPRQAVFLERAVASINAQTVLADFDVTVLVGVDAGQVPEGDIGRRLGVTFVESHGRSQAAALNAAIRLADTEFVAFLEDDDQWYPQYLENAIWALSLGAFVSSTQVEFDENNVLLRVNDFPTPSGWFMPLTTLRAVGEFDEEYRFHLDNEWLGKLGEAGVARLHMVESTAPVGVNIAARVRPWLARVVRMSGGFARLWRHASPYPLVRRLVHPQSGMAQRATNPAVKEMSEKEYARLIDRFGRIPW